MCLLNAVNVYIEKLLFVVYVSRIYFGFLTVREMRKHMHSSRPVRITAWDER